MNVVGHDDEFVEEVFALISVMKNGFEKGLGETVGFEDGTALPCRSGDEVGIAFVEEGAESSWAQDGTSAAEAAEFSAS
jgi:hypothetical protein